MATTAEELLALARREVIAAARSLPPATPSGRSGVGQRGRVDGGDRGASRAMAMRLYRDQEAAWPDLASAARYALEASIWGQGDRDRVVSTLASLDRVRDAVPLSLARHGVDRLSPVLGDPDPRLVRGARLIAAAGEAIRTGPAASRYLTSPTDRHAAAADIAATVLAAASLTTAYAEQARESVVNGAGGLDTAALTGVSAWRQLVGDLEGLTAGTTGTTPATRASTMTSRVVLTPFEADHDWSLTGALAEWSAAAVELMTAARSGASLGGGSIADADLRGLSLGMSLVHIAAAQDRLSGASNEVRRTHAAAAAAWRRTGDAWLGQLRLPGLEDERLPAAHRHLLAAVNDHLTDTRDTSLRRRDTASLTAFLQGDAIRLAGDYAALVGDIVRAVHPLAAARVVLTEAKADLERRVDEDGPRRRPIPDPATPEAAAALLRTESPEEAAARLASHHRPVNTRPRIPLELADAARRGRWVTVPADSPIARRVSAGATAADHATLAASRAARSEVSDVDPEVAAARRAAQAAFPTSLRDTLAGATSARQPADDYGVAAVAPVRVPVPRPDRGLQR